INNISTIHDMVQTRYGDSSSVVSMVQCCALFKSAEHVSTCDELAVGIVAATNATVPTIGGIFAPHLPLELGLVGGGGTGGATNGTTGTTHPTKEGV
ncbi:MAG: hypothetical protein ACKPKO_27950, partial [Candidatus Fonsibacter sp.]